MDRLRSKKGMDGRWMDARMQEASRIWNGQRATNEEKGEEKGIRGTQKEEPVVCARSVRRGKGIWP